MTELAAKIAKYIAQERGCSYSDIQARADSKGIARHELEAAMAIVHRSKLIKATSAGGDIQYAVAPLPKKESPFERYALYPEFIRGVNDASHPVFAGISYKYLFLTPEEMLKYKAELKGKAYIPRRRYEHTRR